jgi:hypothetical protein
MRVAVRGHGQISLPDDLADSRPWDTAQMQERDPSMAQVARREDRDPLRLADLRDRGPEGIRAAADKQPRLRVAASLGVGDAPGGMDLVPVVVAVEHPRSDDPHVRSE